jgi:hypothetical protein
VSSTYGDERRLLLPLHVADGGLFPRRLDLGLAGSIRVEDYFLFSNFDFGCQYATTDKKRDYFFIREMILIGLTDTYNLLPTDTKNCFFNSDRQRSAYRGVAASPGGA